MEIPHDLDFKHMLSRISKRENQKSYYVIYIMLGGKQANKWAKWNFFQEEKRKVGRTGQGRGMSQVEGYFQEISALA